MTALLALIRHDLALAFRQRGDSAMIMAFFVLTVILFPFGIGPEPNTLARVAPGILWVMALLASLLSLERLFQTDYEDGSLELLTLAPIPLELVVLGKVAVHWLTTGLPLMIAAPILAFLLHLPADGYIALLAGMLLGTPLLSLIGAMGAALVLGARRGGVLLSLLVLPLDLPVLIFAVGAIDSALMDLSFRPHLLLLAALLALALPLAPIATAAALRQALE